MNLLIVDDEVIAINGLLAGLNWDELHFDHIYTAYDYREAMRLMGEVPIDLVLCDIEMPQRSGLELYEWVCAKYPDIDCIFITGHANFQYAQQALRLGSIDYLLKPVPYPELERCLQNAIYRISERKREERILQYGEGWMEQAVDQCSQRSEDETAAQEIVAAVEQFVAQNIREDLSVDSIAKQFHLHPDHLTRLFKKKKDVPLLRYIIQQRMKLAEYLLTETNSSANVVAQEVGIPNYSYFVRLFKREFGISPSQYRKNN